LAWQLEPLIQMRSMGRKRGRPRKTFTSEFTRFVSYLSLIVRRAGGRPSLHRHYEKGKLLDLLTSAATLPAGIHPRPIATVDAQTPQAENINVIRGFTISANCCRYRDTQDRARCGPL
jgi:hypothetical protein